MITQAQAQQLIGQKLRTTDGDKVGTIGQVYVDDQTGQPEWATVNTGFFGTNESFVPLAEATISDEDLVVPYSKSQIKNAPNIDETGHLSPAEERELYAHYNVSYPEETSYAAPAPHAPSTRTPTARSVTSPTAAPPAMPGPRAPVTAPRAGPPIRR